MYCVNEREEQREEDVTQEISCLWNSESIRSLLSEGEDTGGGGLAGDN